MRLKYINTFHQSSLCTVPLLRSLTPHVSHTALCSFTPLITTIIIITIIFPLFLPSIIPSACSSPSKLKSIWYGVWPLASQLLSIEVIVTHREMKTASIMFDLASRCLRRISPLSFRQAACTCLHIYPEWKHDIYDVFNTCRKCERI